MGTIGLDTSRRFAEQISAAGGIYIEVPVSGSADQAELGTLIAMTAGGAVDAVLGQVLDQLCANFIECGPVPSALGLKLAVNTALITSVTGLVEAFSNAEALGVDTGLLRDVLLAGPLASDVMRIKLDKLIKGDWTTQASLANVFENGRIIVEEVAGAERVTPTLGGQRR